MTREEHIAWLKAIKDSISGGDEEFDNKRRESLDAGISALERANDDWKEGFDMGWEEAKVFYEEEPTEKPMPLDCGNCEIVQASINTGIRTASKLVDDVLDKIRAEIDGIEINGQVDEHTLFIRSGEQVKQMTLDIIDKYREEQTDAT